MIASLPGAVWLAFATLAVAMAALWAPGFTRVPGSNRWWLAPFAVALLVSLAADLVDTRGLLAIAALVVACRMGEHAATGSWRGFGLALMLVLSAGLTVHAVPGFANPVVLDAVRLSADSLPYTKSLNLDKGVLGLLLLALFAPARARRAPGAGSAITATWQFAMVTGAVMALTVVVGYARWDPKLPAWWPLWLASMVFLTALPEEALFRHVIQGGLQDWLGGTARSHRTAAGVSAALFGLAHVAGGWTYVLLATVAGLGYAAVYMRTGSVLAAIAAHTALNALHVVLFSYPALDRTITTPR
ncbi:MAG: lysostaphin resistance A-like protein [Vicinamibacterales bacterium]